MRAQVKSKLLKLLLFSLISLKSFASEIKIDFDSEEFYVVKANKVEFADVISLYNINGNIYIPLLPFLNAIHAQYAQNQQQISGWIFNKDNHFIYPKQHTENTFFYDNTLYFNLTEFCQEKAITINNNIENGVLLLTSTNIFGHQINAILNNNRNNQKQKRSVKKIDIEHNYNIITTPIISTTLAVNKTSDSTTVNTSIRSSGDFFWGTLDSNASMQDDKFKINHVNYSKILNNSVVSSFEFGDISSNSKHRLLSNLRGKGMQIQKSKQESMRFFNNETIQGYYKPNYTVELLDNGHVIEVAETDDSGYYKFENIPLFIGNNNYILKFYGEYGDIYLKDNSYKINGQLTQKNEINYSAFVMDTQNSSLKEKVHNNNRAFNAEVSYGLSNSFTYNVGITRNNLKTFLSNSISATTKNTSNQIEITNTNKQWLAAARSLGKVFNTNYNFKVAKLSDRENISLYLNKHIISTLSVLNNTSLSGQFQLYNNEKSFKLGFNKRIGKLSTRYDWANDKGNISNQISVYTTLNGFNFRYKIRKKEFNTEHNLTVTKRLWNTRFSLKANKGQSYILSARKQFKEFDFNSQLGYTDGHYTFGLNISTNIWFDEKPRYTRRSLQSTGAIKAITFIDENYNNKRDHNEQGLSNVTFEGKRLWSEIKTNKNGVAILPGINHLYATEIAVDPADIHDFTLMIPEPSIINTHKGGVTEVQIPLKRVKIIEFILKDEQGRLLVNTKFTMTSNKQIIKGYTDEEGYYFNEEIFPGEFTLKTSELEANISISMNKNIEEYYFEEVIAKKLIKLTRLNESKNEKHVLSK
ncbi:hypothetical protein CJF42_24030 [Pseudoalteromonas sp. NBT06-2]|uniref:hypothetical protein n=1 Tax=Pseudoalteromonas sp. NBT06-2 TaxID=2025950 RepID=UPI000BA62739|nr:hypothetical protein [Pseudoalteromonas sp. NBT06-2]PAJ71933.1 hypothetical protein CJF42_24030 [Pseudoalteromonas sp. NBT06-2]